MQYWGYWGYVHGGVWSCVVKIGLPVGSVELSNSPFYSSPCHIGLAPRKHARLAVTHNQSERRVSESRQIIHDFLEVLHQNYCISFGDG